MDHKSYRRKLATLFSPFGFRSLSTLITLLTVLLIPFFSPAHIARALLLADVAVFYDPAYVDTADKPWGEATNTLMSLSALGHAFVSFEGISADSFSTALRDKDVLSIPELETADLGTDLSSSAKTTIRNFVLSGGNLIIHGAESGRAANLLNQVFGFGLSTSSCLESGSAYLNTVAAAGTAFEGGPPSIPLHNCTHAILSGLPTGSRSIYTTAAGGGGDTIVALIPYGSGEINYLGWSWYDAQPNGSQDGGWVDVLDRAASLLRASVPFADVAVFYDRLYVDIADKQWGEATNVWASLTEVGHTVVLFKGISAADFDTFSTALTGKDVFVIPELEIADLGADLSSSVRAVIRTKVSSGGNLIIHGAESGRAANLLNQVFGFGLSTSSCLESGSAYLNMVAAAGTAFEGGPPSIPLHNCTHAILSGLPVGSRSIYTTATGGGGNAVVALIPYGSGEIHYLGWSWYDAQPNGSQNGGWLDVLDRAVSTTSPGPQPPTYLNATAVSQSQINLIWQDNSTDESSFYVERSPNGSTGWTQIATVGANTTNYSDTGLSPATTYCYRIRAYRSSDGQYSSYSNVDCETTQNRPQPPPPTSLNATVVSQSQINLTWQDNSTDESSFYIERSPNGSTGWTQIATAGTNATSHSDTGLNCGTTYYYRVRAYRGSDGQYSSYSNTDGAPMQACPFSKTSPANGTTEQPLTTTLRWGSSEGASSYEYCIDTRKNTVCDETWIHVGSGSTVDLFGLKGGTTYHWQVRAQNTSGTTAANSGAWWSFTTWESELSTIYLPALLRIPTATPPPYAPPCDQSNDCEPYNKCKEAYGPLASGVAYRAYPNDTNDYYYFEISHQKKVRITVDNYKPTSSNGTVILYGPAAGSDCGERIAYFGPREKEKMILEPPDPLQPGRYHVLVRTSGQHSLTSLYSLTLNY